MNFTAIGGRRFVLAVFVFIVCVVMRWLDKLADGSFSEITMASVVSLIAGHTVEAVKKESK
jgi:hypothetical protein